MTADRITFDGEHPDELVLHGVTVHLERMSWHLWWGMITLPSGAVVDLTFRDLGIDIEAEHEAALPTSYGPELLGCDTEWTSHGRLHRCRINPHQHSDSLRHLCECGSWKKD